MERGRRGEVVERRDEEEERGKVGKEGRCGCVTSAKERCRVIKG